MTLATSVAISDERGKVRAPPRAFFACEFVTESVAAVVIGANGVDDLRWLSGVEACALEPALQCTAALLSPSTGIIDSHGLMLALLGGAERADAFHAEIRRWSACVKSTPNNRSSAMLSSVFEAQHKC